MGAQSLVIGKMFGEGFQYGKRKISAMSNEEFNKLTFEDMMSNARTELKASIPTINASLQDMDEMVVVVVNEFLKYLGLVTKTVLETTVAKSIDIAEAGAHLIGTHVPGVHTTTAQTEIDVSPITPDGTLAEPPREITPTYKAKNSIRYPISFLQVNTATGALTTFTGTLDYYEARNLLLYYTRIVDDVIKLDQFVRNQFKIATPTLVDAKFKIWGP